MAEAAPCVDQIVNSDASVLSKESQLEGDSYHTWPSKVSPVRGEVQSSGEKCSSLDTVQQQDPATTQPMTMEAALASLNISYSPASRCLQEAAPAPAPAAVEEDGEAEAQYSYYKPGHRKAYSLPRTLEGVAEDGSIARPRLEHDCAVESPRTTLQRYGLAYQPYNFQQRGPAEDAVSEVSEAGVSGVSDLSSLGDSGVFSEASDRSRLKKGFGEMLSKGFAANLKLLSKSGQQMVRLVRKDGGEAEPGPGPCAASSQSLIMEARPPGVPAKSAQEEEKHRAEHRQLLEKLRRREQSEVRSRAGRLQQQRRAEDDLSQLTSHWQTAVLPHWSPSLAASKKVQALWWRGLPPPVRGRVWRLGLANTLNLSPQLFSILVTRAREQLAASPAPSSCVSREETLELVRLDVSRTFPQLCIFQPGGPYCQLLHNVLGAYVCYRPDIGYVQGMSFIAAILILNLDEADAFIMFANLLNWPLLAAFYTVDQAQMEACYTEHSRQLAAHLPALAAHFTRLGLRPDLYLLDWVMTLYSRCCPLDVTCRVWDLLVRDGEGFLLRTALGILALYEDTLLAETDFVLIAQFLSKLPDDINCDLLFEKIEALSSAASKRTFPTLSSLW